MITKQESGIDKFEQAVDELVKVTKPKRKHYYHNKSKFCKTTNDGLVTECDSYAQHLERFDDERLRNIREIIVKLDTDIDNYRIHVIDKGNNLVLTSYMPIRKYVWYKLKRLFRRLKK